MCQNKCTCPTSDARDARSARVVADHSEQGWCLLCNGVILFDDGGALLPSGLAITPPPPSRDDQASISAHKCGPAHRVSLAAARVAV